MTTSKKPKVPGGKNVQQKVNEQRPKKNVKEESSGQLSTIPGSPRWLKQQLHAGRIPAVVVMLVMAKWIVHISGVLLCLYVIIGDDDDVIEAIDPELKTMTVVILVLSGVFAMLSLTGVCGVMTHCRLLYLMSMFSDIICFCIYTGLLLFFVVRVCDLRCHPPGVRLQKTFDLKNVRRIDQTTSNLQSKGKCCGYNGSVDYFNAQLVLPDSCCKQTCPTDKSEATYKLAIVHTEACKRALPKFVAYWHRVFSVICGLLVFLCGLSAALQRFHICDESLIRRKVGKKPRRPISLI